MATTIVLQVFRDLANGIELRVCHAAIADGIDATCAEFKVAGQADTCLLDISLAAGDCDPIRCKVWIVTNECLLNQ